MNLLPVEDFLNKARIARKSNQKTLVLSTKEYTDLYDSLASVMTRLSSVLDQSATSSETNIVVKMDGGTF
jgi:dsDNA-binding SOS-regulon protein